MLKAEEILVYVTLLLICTAWVSACYQRQRFSLCLLFGCSLSSASSLALRWIAHGQGPFLTLYEVLLSNLFSISLLTSLIIYRNKYLRQALPNCCFLLMLITVWILITNSQVIPLPPTFSNGWLWVHVITGKFFLGLLWVVAGYSVYALCTEGDNHSVESLLYRCFCGAFLFHGLMILSGMVWALEAWGHFWGWDGVEVWSLIIWLLMAVLLHARQAYRISLNFQMVGSLVVFCLAFITFFGVPFLSIAPHKGVF